MGRHTRALAAVNWRQCKECRDKWPGRAWSRSDNLSLVRHDYADEVATQIMAWHDRIGNEMLLDFKRTKREEATPANPNEDLSNGMEKQEP